MAGSSNQIIQSELYSSTGATTNGSTAAIAGTTAGGNNNLFINWTLFATQNKIAFYGGFYSTGAGAGDLFVVERTGAGNYTVWQKVPYSHTGSGFEYFLLPAPLFIKSANYCIGLFNTSGVWSFDQTTQERASQVAEPTVGSAITGLAETVNAVFVGAFKY